MENQHSMYQSEETRRISMEKPKKEVKMVFHYASPDPERDSKILTQVAQYFAKEIKQKRVATIKPQE